MRGAAATYWSKTECCMRALLSLRLYLQWPIWQVSNSPSGDDDDTDPRTADGFDD